MRSSQKPDHVLKYFPTLGTLVVACCLGAAGCGAENERTPSSNQKADPDDSTSEVHAAKPADQSAEDSEEGSAAPAEGDTAESDSAESDPDQDPAAEESSEGADDAVETEETEPEHER